MKKQARAFWILISISSFYSMYSMHTQQHPKFNYIQLKAQIAQKCLPNNCQKARILFSEVVAELSSYYTQQDTNKQNINNELADLLSKAEFHLACIEEEAHNSNACLVHFDKALSYTRGFFLAAFARLSVVYMQLLEDSNSTFSQELLINYVNHCNKYLANSTLLPYEVIYIAELVRARIQLLLAENWSQLPATTAENRESIQKALEYLPQLKLYVETHRSVFDPLAQEQYITSSYYYSILLWFSLGNYYADQATLSCVPSDYDKALQYFTLILQAHPELVQAYDKLVAVYQAQKELSCQQTKLYKRYTYLKNVIEESFVIKNNILLKKVALLQATGKKKQLEQTIELLEDGLYTLLSKNNIYCATLQKQFMQQLAEAKLQQARFKVRDKSKAYKQYLPDVEYALTHGTPSVQADALLMKAIHALAHITVCTDFDEITTLIHQARTKTSELPNDLAFVTTEYHKRRAAFLLENPQLLTTTALQEKFHESVVFCSHSCDSTVKHEGLYYKILWLIKQQTNLDACQALELLQELQFEQYNPRKIKHIVTLLYTLAEQFYQQNQYTYAQELLEVLWQEYQSLASGILLVTILAQHKESLEYALRLIGLIKHLLPLAGQHTQALQGILESCYYTKACHESTSFDKVILEQALCYFKDKQLLADPAAQRAYTALAQQAETAEELFALVDRLQSITPYTKDTLINLLHNFCRQKPASKQPYRQEITKKENFIKKYTLFLTVQEQQNLLSTLYTIYIPLLIEQYASMCKKPNQSKKESKKCIQLLTYIQQLCAFLRKQNTTQQILARYQTQLQQVVAQLPNHSANKRVKQDLSATVQHTTVDIEQTVTCLENLSVNDTITSNDKEQVSNTALHSADQSQEHDRVTDYYFFQGVYYARQEYTLRCQTLTEQLTEQLSGDSTKNKNTYAQLLYNQAQEYLLGDQQAITYGLELLKNSAALDNLAAAFELAHLYRRTHTLWPSLYSTLVDPAAYGLPDYTYLVRLTNQPLTQSTAYKNWRSAYATQACHNAEIIKRALVWSAYNPAIDSQVYNYIEQDKALCDAYLCGVAYAYFEHCARICLASSDQCIRDYASVIAQLLEETLMCPEQVTDKYSRQKKRKKPYLYDNVAQEIAAWFERTGS